MFRIGLAGLESSLIRWVLFLLLDSSNENWIIRKATGIISLNSSGPWSSNFWKDLVCNAELVVFLAFFGAALKRLKCVNELFDYMIRWNARSRREGKSRQDWCKLLKNKTKTSKTYCKGGWWLNESNQTNPFGSANLVHHIFRLILVFYEF